MKTKPPFDSTFERVPEPLFKWQYQDSKVNAAYVAWGLQYQFSLAALDDYLQEDCWEISEAAQENRANLIQRRAQALQAFQAGNTELAFAWLNFLNAVMRATKRQDFLLPLSREGKKFKSGRMVGGVGPVRSGVRRHLKNNPRDSADAIWRAMSLKHHKALAFYDNPRGRYIEIDIKILKGKLPPDGKQIVTVQMPRFRNIVTAERKLLRAKKPEK